MSDIIPRVFPVATTSLHAGLDAYLRSIGAIDMEEKPDWKTDAPSHGEKLIEIAGRLCYNSFFPYDPERPGCTNANVETIREGNSKYISNLIKSGHGCYDSETDVLTSEGWIPWPKITGNELFATRNSAGKIDYHKAININLGEHYKGNMYHVIGNSVDLFVTPNHNMYVCLTTTMEGRKKEKYELIPAYLVDNKAHAYIKTGKYIARSSKYSYEDLALIGFSIGDGNLYNGIMKFHLRKERKIVYLENLCRQLCLDLVFNTDNDAYWIYWPYIFDLKKDGEKYIPEQLLFEENIQGLYDGLINSDGSITDSGDKFFNTSKLLTDQFQHLCLHIGLSSNIEISTNRENSFGDKTLYISHVIRRENRPEVNRWSGAWGATHWVNDWEGKVYCVEVPNNTLYVRRNGRAVWCGNSVLEHVNVSMIFQNVSRVFTAELCRHRAGMSYSERSMRFVRMESVPYWKTPLLRDQNLEFQMEFEMAIEQIEGSVQRLIRACGLEGIRDFGTKKALTSLIRRIIPMGVCTTIMATGNLRSWRHIMGMRTAGAAEEEIRNVMDQVGHILKGEYPNVFADMIRQDDGQWILEKEKV
jgi:flavin-dependent thymidylate synthase